MTPTLKSLKYNWIQALRALAALMVVVFHSKSMFADDGTREQLWWVPGFSDFGDYGVSLFFVISGFIIATVLDRPSLSILDFIKRRFFRIFPLLWVVMFVAAYHYYLRNWYAAEFEALGLKSFAMSAFAIPQKDYPFWAPGWTLEHEVLFYVIAALVFPFVRLKGLAIILVALGVLGILFKPGWDYHLTYNGQIYFAGGIFAYLFKEAGWRKALPLALLGLGLVYAGAYKLIPLNPNLGHFLFSLGAGALIVASIDIERRGIVPPKAITLLGDASDSLYLWHWLMIPIAALFMWKWGGPNEMWRWIYVGASIVVALLSFQMIEKPIIAFSHRKWFKRHDGAHLRKATRTSARPRT